MSSLSLTPQGSLRLREIQLFGLEIDLLLQITLEWNIGLFTVCKDDELPT